MWRPVLMIAAAIHMVNPSLGKATTRMYAKALQHEAVAHDFDPYTGVAIGWHESHWIAASISPNGCFGLFQVCVTDPAKGQSLLDGVAAIHVLGDQIGRWRRYCRTATGKSATLPRWLAGYQGVDASRGTTCNQRRVHGRWVDMPLAPATASVISFRKKIAK